jgi:hypothetical protein
MPRGVVVTPGEDAALVMIELRAVNTARVWLLNADLDFPADQVRLLIQAATGTDYDILTRQVKTLDPARWREIRNRSEQIAAQHAKTCNYPDANQWLQLHNLPGH